MTDPHHVYRPLLDLIGFTEGTDKGDGYNETLAYGAYTGGDVNLVGMSLAEVDQLQTKMLAHPSNKMNSSAIGRYQIVRTTLRPMKAQLRLSELSLYDEDTQDRLARYLLWGRGIDDYCEGRLSEDKMLLELAREWASLPTPSGSGYYGGQHAAVAPQRVREVLHEVKARYNGPPSGEVVGPTIPEVPPGEVEAPREVEAPEELIRKIILILQELLKSVKHRKEL